MVKKNEMLIKNGMVLPKPKRRPTLILEGVDCGGKTHLAQEIQMRWKCKYLHVKQAPDGVDTLTHFMGKLKNIRQPTIIDRLHWSEQVYAKILREDSLLSDRDFGVIDGYMIAHKGIFIRCSPPLQVVLDKINQDTDGENHNEETATRVWQEYYESPRTVLPIIDYDYTTQNVDQLLGRAEMIMETFYG